MPRTPPFTFPRGMTEHQFLTACLCGRSIVTPAYAPPGEYFTGQERRWHTPQQCGPFESNRLAAPTPAILREVGESEEQWQKRMCAAYPIIGGRDALGAASSSSSS